MQEQHLRHQYLEAIGIDSWLARKVIPNAAPSPDWVSEFSSGDFDQQSAQVNTSQHSVNKTKPTANDTQPAASVGGIKSLSASLDQPNIEQATQVNPSLQQQAQEQAHDTVSHLPVTDVAQVTPKEIVDSPQLQSETQPQTQAAPSALSQMPRHAPMGNRTEKSAPVMRLMIWQFKEVLVIDSVPTHTRGTMASEQYQQLLTNIINALQFDSQLLQPNGQPFILNWPTLAGSSIDQGWDQAVSAVQHKLAKVLHSYQPKLALLLGEHSAQMVMNVDEPFDDIRGMVFSLRSDIKAIAGYSLTQLLNVPSCKRELWIDLQKMLNN
jgi:hypothetical protein